MNFIRSMACHATNKIHDSLVKTLGLNLTVIITFFLFYIAGVVS